LALRHSYVYHVLKFLRNGQARTALDLLRLLAVERENMRSKEGKNLVGPESLEQMEGVLAGLAEIGVLSIGSDGRISSDNDLPSPSFDGGGDEGGTPGGPTGPESGDGGGAGLSEILGHAVLFCLPDDAQDALLDAAFSAGLPEEGAHG